MTTTKRWLQLHWRRIICCILLLLRIPTRSTAFVFRKNSSGQLPVLFSDISSSRRRINEVVLYRRKKNTALFDNQDGQSANDNNNRSKNKKGSSNNNNKQQQPQQKKKNYNNSKKKRKYYPPKKSSLKKKSGTESDNAAKKKKADEIKAKKKQQIARAIQKARRNASGGGGNDDGALRASDEVTNSAENNNDNYSKSDNRGGILNNLNPFQAGQSLRRNLDAALTSLAQSQEDRKKSIFYLDDTFLERNPRFDDYYYNSDGSVANNNNDDFVPEVLVVGATGEVGRLVVQRLLLEQGRYRVRVLVRNLYSQTLNALGTGVTYCQGDLHNVESLEYALTDVDKIIFVAGAPRPDEDNFQTKFKNYMNDNIVQEDNKNPQQQPQKHNNNNNNNNKRTESSSNLDWEQLESVLEVRAQLAEQVDLVGVQNVLTAYQNVRYADYGTSQTAKRTLFRFDQKSNDHDIFYINDAAEEEVQEEQESNSPNNEQLTTTNKKRYDQNYNEYGDTYDDGFDNDKYEDYYDDDDDYANYASQFDDNNSQSGESTTISSSASTTVSVTSSRCQWLQNDFGRSVFVGQVPTNGGEASVISTRLRSAPKKEQKQQQDNTTGDDVDDDDNANEDDDEEGIDLSLGFAGLIARICADGRNYEAFIRTGLYKDEGIEYVCEFSTRTKLKQAGNKSKNKFMTVRLPFANFQPVNKKRSTGGGASSITSAPKFTGSDVRYIGFRHRSDSNSNNNNAVISNNKNNLIKTQQQQNSNNQFSDFYLAFAYLKVYRAQPEPEFVYLSDARIPMIVADGMVRHDLRRVIEPAAKGDDNNNNNNVNNDGYRIFDDQELKRITENKKERSPEETYYKLRGEELIKNSGISYAIVRVAGFNESPTIEASTIDLVSSNHGMLFPISRAEAAQVCVSTLLDPNALNKSFYVTKKKSSGTFEDENISDKFADLSVDPLL